MMSMDSSSESEDTVELALESCQLLQYMIDSNSKLLDGLRTQCSVREEITQQEIRQLEVCYCV